MASNSEEKHLLCFNKSAMMLGSEIFIIHYCNDDAENGGKMGYYSVQGLPVG